jgi:Icc-related predicted phosphoesterase
MRYRLLCCSDTHGEAPPAVADSTATAWLHAGDLYEGPAIVGRDDEPPLPGDPIAEVFLAWARQRRAPVYAVHGNHDVGDPYGWFAAVHEVDGRVERLGADLLLVGIGWHGEVYFELPREADLDGVCERARQQVQRHRKASDRVVLLTHYPPLLPGLFPPRRGRTATAADGGSEVLARFVRELKPLLVVQGHEHRWSRLTGRFDLDGQSVLVINPGRAGMSVVVDTETAAAEVE